MGRDNNIFKQYRNVDIVMLNGFIFLGHQKSDLLVQSGKPDWREFEWWDSHKWEEIIISSYNDSKTLKYCQ